MTPEENRERDRALEIERASAALMAQLPKKKASSKKSLSRADIESIQSAADAMRETQDFRRGGALHLVALWAWCHEKTYGVAPAMSGKEWSLAGMIVGKLLRTEFDGKAERMVELIRWTWADEKRSLKWRKENGRTVIPLGWRIQFGARQVVRYRANGGGA